MKRHARSTSARVGGALHRKVRRGKRREERKKGSGEEKRRKEGRSEESRSRKGAVGTPKGSRRHGSVLVGEGAARGGRPGGGVARGDRVKD